MSDSQKDKDKTPGRRPRTPATNGMRFGRGVVGWVLFLAVVILLFLYVSTQSKGVSEVSIDKFYAMLDDGKVKDVKIIDDGIAGTFSPPLVSTDGKPNIDKFKVSLPIMFSSQPQFIDKLIYQADGKPRTIPVSNENSNNLLLNILIPFVPWVIVFVIIWFIFIRQLRNSGGAGGMLGNFGRSKHRITSKEHTNVTFDDVAGIQEAKEEVSEIVEFLKNPKRFQRLGGRIPKGVLLVGEPGTGKTLLAKAIAGEADAPFFSISGSDFVEMFVGVGASRVRDLFKQAKDNSPCIIFLDEIDAVGRRRGSGFSSGGHDEREQTLNAILVEMDGFDSNDQVIVCAATNRVDVLDPALTRPGRFDRQVNVPLPDVQGRLEILKVHSRKIKLGPDVDLARLAKATPGFSGADLAAINNEAALGATLLNKDFVEQVDLEEARDKVRFGRAKRSRVIDEKDKLATAYHEAGHAIIQYLEREDADPIHKVTIIPRGNYGGATMTLPERDRTSQGRKWCIAFIKMGLAGRIAEEMFTDDVNTGAYGDIRQVSSLARRMISEWGMNERVGFVYYGEADHRQNGFDFGGSKEWSESTQQVIDEEVKKMIDTLEIEVKRTLVEYKPQIEALARALMKYETLDGNEVTRIMQGETLTKPTVSDMIQSPPQPPRQVTIAPEPPRPLNLGGGPLPQPG